MNTIQQRILNKLISSSLTWNGGRGMSQGSSPEQASVMRKQVSRKVFQRQCPNLGFWFRGLGFHGVYVRGRVFLFVWR